MGKKGAAAHKAVIISMAILGSLGTIILVGSITVAAISIPISIPGPPTLEYMTRGVLWLLMIFAAFPIIGPLTAMLPIEAGERKGFLTVQGTLWSNELHLHFARLFVLIQEVSLHSYDRQFVNQWRVKVGLCDALLALTKDIGEARPHDKYVIVANAPEHFRGLLVRIGFRQVSMLRRDWLSYRILAPMAAPLTLWLFTRFTSSKQRIHWRYTFSRLEITSEELIKNQDTIANLRSEFVQKRDAL